MDLHSVKYLLIKCLVLLVVLMKSVMKEYIVSFSIFSVTFLVLQRVTERQNTVELTGRMWARVLSSTNQPSFVTPQDLIQDGVQKETMKEINK